SVVDLAARRTHQAARLRAEAEILSYLAGNVLRGETGLEDLLERVRETFGMESAALLERAGDLEPWTCAGRAGTDRPVDRPEDADVDVPVGDHMALALTGRVLTPRHATTPPRTSARSGAGAAGEQRRALFLHQAGFGKALIQPLVPRKGADIRRHQKHCLQLIFR